MSHQAAARDIHPVVLCGGTGTRLWPLSRPSLPKPFIPVLAGKSLLQHTLERLKELVEGVPITCVGSVAHASLVAEISARSRIRVAQLLEPHARGTAAAIAMAAIRAPADALLFISPADHHVPGVSDFCDAVALAADSAREGAIVLLGVTPHSPSSEFGYIVKGSPLRSGGFAVDGFVEKPPAAQAMDMLAGGQHLWNVGIVLARAGRLIDAFKMHAPDVLAACERAVSAGVMAGEHVTVDSIALERCRNESFDRAVLEKSHDLVVHRYAGGWSDVGSWNALMELSPADVNGNRTLGGSSRTRHFDSCGTYVRANGDRTVVTIGTRDLLIVDASDTLLVAARDSVHDLREVAAAVDPALGRHRGVAR